MTPGSVLMLSHSQQCQVVSDGPGPHIMSPSQRASRQRFGLRTPYFPRTRTWFDAHTSSITFSTCGFVWMGLSPDRILQHIRRRLFSPTGAFSIVLLVVLLRSRFTFCELSRRLLRGPGPRENPFAASAASCLSSTHFLTHFRNHRRPVFPPFRMPVTDLPWSTPFARASPLASRQRQSLTRIHVTS